MGAEKERDHLENRYPGGLRREGVACVTTVSRVFLRRLWSRCRSSWVAFAVPRVSAAATPAPTVGVLFWCLAMSLSLLSSDDSGCKR